MVFIPKHRRKALYEGLRRRLGNVFYEPTGHKKSEIIEGYLMFDHVHMCIAIPPRVAVSNVVGYIKGKSAIWIARHVQGRKRNFGGQNFWARGYYVNTVGFNEQVAREYIHNQENEDRRLDQLQFSSSV